MKTLEKVMEKRDIEHYYVHPFTQFELKVL